MAIFSKHKTSLVDIIKEISDSALSTIAKKTRVDYCSKVLSGKLMFYLLLYGMLQVDRLSQRGLRDAFSSQFFKLVFNYNGKTEISHSSISERLSKIDLKFFRESYECIYSRFSGLYAKKEISNMYLQRVDSALVAEASNKLKEGLICGNQHVKKKMLKYTFNYDGMFASLCSIHKESSYTSESLALPENVMKHFRKKKIMHRYISLTGVSLPH